MCYPFLQVETKLAGNFVAACAHDRNSQNCRCRPECASSNLLFLLAWTRQEQPCWCCRCAPMAANCAPASLNPDSNQKFDSFYPSSRLGMNLSINKSYFHSTGFRVMTQFAQAAAPHVNGVGAAAANTCERCGKSPQEFRKSLGLYSECTWQSSWGNWCFVELVLQTFKRWGIGALKLWLYIMLYLGTSNYWFFCTIGGNPPGKGLNCSSLI